MNRHTTVCKLISSQLDLDKLKTFLYALIWFFLMYNNLLLLFPKSLLMFLEMSKTKKNIPDAKYLFHGDCILSSIQETSPFHNVF